MDEKDIAPGVEDSLDKRDLLSVERHLLEDDRLGERKDDNLKLDDSKQRPTSLQQKMLAMAGQDIDQFMKEVKKKN